MSVGEIVLGVNILGLLVNCYWGYVNWQNCNLWHEALTLANDCLQKAKRLAEAATQERPFVVCQVCKKIVSRYDENRRCISCASISIRAAN